MFSFQLYTLVRVPLPLKTKQKKKKKMDRDSDSASPKRALRGKKEGGRYRKRTESRADNNPLGRGNRKTIFPQGVD